MWEKVRLEEVTNVITCGVAKRPEYVDSGIMFLSSKNVKANTFFLNEFNKISYKDYSKLTKVNKPEKGDILYTRVGSFGEAAVIDFDDDFAIFVSLTLIKPKHNVLFNRYLMHYLNSEPVKFHAINNTTGIGVQNLNVSVVREYIIPLPTIEIQRHIAHILDKTNETITLRKKQLEELDNLIKSVFYDMFGDPISNDKGWITYKGNEYSDLLTVGVVVKPASYYTDTGVIALRSLNIKPNYIDLNNLVYFSEESSNGVLAKSVLRHGDIVVVRTGLTGTAAVIPKNLEGANCIDLIIVRPKKNLLNPHYLAFLLNSERGKRLVASKEVGGIQKHFNIGAIKDIPFPIPPLLLQNQFATIVEKIEEQKVLVQKALNENQYLFDSLMDKYFGE